MNHWSFYDALPFSHSKGFILIFDLNLDLCSAHSNLVHSDRQQLRMRKTKEFTPFTTDQMPNGICAKLQRRKVISYSIVWRTFYVSIFFFHCCCCPNLCYNFCESRLTETENGKGQQYLVCVHFAHVFAYICSL